MRYSIELSRTMGLSLHEVLQWDEAHLLLHLAYDRSQSADFQAALKRETERERQRAMTVQERSLAFAQSIGMVLPPKR